ncbi:MAG: RpiB/LacA/LacB family sugar-phosphate isomerase [Candidatus Dojkabacteria bacterium]|nr:RpiB/LacA/LacB family sugar-phosphate isomerase [Candidatus Dojkabacteria bacterium]
MIKVFVGADHGGFSLKSYLLQRSNVELKEFDFIDCGASFYDESDDYVDYVVKVVTHLHTNSYKDCFGVLICRSGIGMSIAANKFKSIYAALCFSVTHAKKAREHNNANVLCLDSDYHQDNEYIFEILKTFLYTNFSFEQRHCRRIKKIVEIENKLLNTHVLGS